MSNIKEITDFNASELDIYARLSELQLYRYNEPEEGIFIAESPKVIERAFSARYQPVSMLIDKADIVKEKGIIDLCGDIPIYSAEADLLAKLTGFKLVRGALCAFRRKKLSTIEEICSNSKRVAVLENVVNPTNVGAIFRSAAAMGIDTVLLTKGCSDPLYRRSARVSMGTVFQINWTFTESDWIERLHNMSFRIAAMALTDNSCRIDDKRISSEPRLAIVLGSEGDGLTSETINACDYTAKIPMSHGVDSLNVAAASAVAFWELSKNNI